MKKTRANEAAATDWYLSREILFFEYEDSSLQDNYLVWENLILIRADTPENAFVKAMSHGELTEGKVTVNGHKGHLRFKGLKELIPVYEEIEDGSEIEWMEYEVSKKDLAKLVQPKNRLQAFS